MPAGYCSSSFSWPEPSERSPSNRSAKERGKKADSEENRRVLRKAKPVNSISAWALIGTNYIKTCVCVCLPDLMWFREANIRSMKEAGTVIVFLVSSSISSFRVITLINKKRERWAQDVHWILWGHTKRQFNLTDGMFKLIGDDSLSVLGISDIWFCNIREVKMLHWWENLSFCKKVVEDAKSLGN